MGIETEGDRENGRSDKVEMQKDLEYLSPTFCSSVCALRKVSV